MNQEATDKLVADLIEKYKLDATERYVPINLAIEAAIREAISQTRKEDAEIAESFCGDVSTQSAAIATTNTLRSLAAELRRLSGEKA